MLHKLKTYVSYKVRSTKKGEREAAWNTLITLNSKRFSSTMFDSKYLLSTKFYGFRYLKFMSSSINWILLTYYKYKKMHFWQPKCNAIYIRRDRGLLFLYTLFPCTFLFADVYFAFLRPGFMSASYAHAYLRSKSSTFSRSFSLLKCIYYYLKMLSLYAFLCHKCYVICRRVFMWIFSNPLP